MIRLALGVLIVSGVVACADSPGGLGPSPQTTRTTIESFTTGVWELRVDRMWDGVSGNIQFPADELDETAYQPVTGGAAYRVLVSDEGRQVAIGEAPIRGTRTAATDSLLHYDLGAGTAAGGRLEVWPKGDGLQGELTLYGSGRPIVKSERGHIVFIRSF